MKDFSTGLERQTRAERVEYPIGKRPFIKIKPYEFEIENISMTGLKFSFKKRPLLLGWQTGTIIFTSGETARVDLIMVSHDNGELGMHLLSPLSSEVVARERKAMNYRQSHKQ